MQSTQCLMSHLVTVWAPPSSSSPAGSVPSPLEYIFVGAWSQSELFVIWYPPLNPNTDPALLRYQVLYGVWSTDLTYPADGSLLGSQAANCTIPGLLAGTAYSLSVLVCSEVGCDTSNLLVTMASTFGLGQL